jgi:hypothetical protein
MSEFVALYRGRTVSDARLVAVSAEPKLVRRFFAELLEDNDVSGGRGKECSTPPLELVRGETGDK